MKKYQILLVEKDERLQFILTLILRKAGYSVVSRDNYETAIKSIPKLKPGSSSIDLLIADIQGEDVNVLFLIEGVKKENPELPVLLITEYGSEDILVKSTGLEFLSLLEKPFEPKELLYQVTAIIERKEIYSRGTKISYSSDKLQQEGCVGQFRMGNLGST